MTKSSSTPSNRSKISAACENCRSNHRKCDGGHPCNNCSKKGRECIYKPRKKRGPKKRVRTEGEAPHPKKKQKTTLATTKSASSNASYHEEYTTTSNGNTSDSSQNLAHVSAPNHFSMHHGAAPPHRQYHHGGPQSMSGGAFQQAHASRHVPPHAHSSAPPYNHPHHHQGVSLYNQQQMHSSHVPHHHESSHYPSFAPSLYPSGSVHHHAQPPPMYSSARGLDAHPSFHPVPAHTPLSPVYSQQSQHHLSAPVPPGRPASRGGSPEGDEVSALGSMAGRAVHPSSFDVPPVSVTTLSPASSGTTPPTTQPPSSQFSISNLYDSPNRFKTNFVQSPEDNSSTSPTTSPSSVSSTGDVQHENNDVTTSNSGKGANVQQTLGVRASNANPFVYDNHQSTLSLYYTTLVSNWIDSYDLYMTPGHSMLPVNRKSFHALVPHLLKDLIVDNPQSKENNFFLCALLANSATSMGDDSFGRSFFTRARQLAGHLFDSIDYRVGLGFMLLCYYSYVHLEVENCVTYMRLSKNIASYFGDGCHLAKQCIVASAYTARTTEGKVAEFEKLGKGDLLTLGDVVWSKVGMASCLAEANPESAPNHFSTIEEALLLLTPENVNSGQLSIWHWFYIHTHRIFVLSLMGRHQEAHDAADVILAKIENPMWKFFNVPMRVRSLAVVAHVYSASKEPLSTETWNKIGKVYDHMETIVKYPYAFSNLNELMKTIESRRCTEAEMAIDGGLLGPDERDGENHRSGIVENGILSEEDHFDEVADSELLMAHDE
uniref:Zn(2)-C6 fungal-type domain-containing protein n=1 Tax=Percolomonas cosmopolitus TaxID=63605 RepID=A0A7S1KNL1_9EUKA